MKNVLTVILAAFVVFAFATVSIAAKKTGTGKKSIQDTVDEKESVKTMPDKKKGTLEPDPWEKTNKVNTTGQQKTN